MEARSETFVGAGRHEASANRRAALQGRFARATLALLLLVFGVAGCKSAVAPVAPRITPVSAPPGRWTESSLENGWITVSVGLPIRGRPPFPAIVSPTVADHLLLERGFAVVRYRTNWAILRSFLPQPAATPAPGPRSPTASPKPQVGAWILASDRPGNVGQAYFAFITNDAKHSIPRVLDHLETVPEIDAIRIGIMGSSTGGFTALQALVDEPRLALGVVQVACGDYHLFLRSSRLALNDDPRWLPDGRLILDTDYEAMLESIEPNRFADRLPPRPLLLMSGSDDPAIPAACVESSVRVFERAYRSVGEGNRFDAVEFRGAGHDLGAAAEERAVDFIVRWLAKRDDRR